MTIDTWSLTVYGNWFDLWQGAVAVEAFCGARGSVGMAWGMGAYNFQAHQSGMLHARLPPFSGSSLVR